MKTSNVYSVRLPLEVITEIDNFANNIGLNRSKAMQTILIAFINHLRLYRQQAEDGRKPKTIEEEIKDMFKEFEYIQRQPDSDLMYKKIFFHSAYDAPSDIY